MPLKTVVIGGGPAGMEAARAAASAGAVVTLVSDSAIGGRAGWHSLLPSKVWLNASNHLHEFSRAGRQGIVNLGRPQLDCLSVLKRITKVAESWNQEQSRQLLDLGVDLVQGTASFVSDREVVIKNSNEDPIGQLQGDTFVVATGSIPRFPPALKPDGKRILAPRFARQLSELPQDVVVIGAGATGSEFVSFFCLAGVRVTWVVDEYGVLPTFDEEAGQSFRQQMEHQGVHIVEPTTAERITSEDQVVIVHTSSGDSYQAAMAFVAIGRTPDLARVDLRAAGLCGEEGLHPDTDHYGRTEKPWIYLAGDVSGSPMVANKALAQAWVAGRHAAGANPSPFNAETIVKGVYSCPEVAEVGSLTGASTFTIAYEKLLKSKLSDYEGFIKLACDGDRRVTGGAAIGPHASEILAPIAVAIQARLTMEELAVTFAAHPTLSELPFLAARMSLEES